MESVVYAVDTWDDPVGAGATAPRYCTIGAVLKQNAENQQFIVANEFICGRLALMIGLPVPPGAIVRTDEDGIGYISLRFGDKDERPPPALLDELIADYPGVVAGIVALDCWVANDDRHAENVAYIRETLPPIIFDHSHALLGPNEGAARLADSDRLLTGSQLGTELEDDAGFEDWCERIGGIADTAIEDLCMAAHEQGAIGTVEAEAARDFLRSRKGRIMDLLRGSTGALPNVQWSLTES